jgi:hypothetical protein
MKLLGRITGLDHGPVYNWSQTSHPNSRMQKKKQLEKFSFFYMCYAHALFLSFSLSIPAI